MRLNQVIWRGMFVMLIVVVGMMSACGGATPAPEEQPTVTPAPSEPTEPPTKDEPTAAPASADGETLLQERCTVCHSLGQVERAQKSREEWERTVASMVGRGAELAQDEQSVLIDYLAETYGP